jgi:hypothetical protein
VIKPKGSYFGESLNEKGGFDFRGGHTKKK